MSHQPSKTTENSIDTVKPETTKQPSKEKRPVKPKIKKRRIFRLFILCLITIIGVGIYFNLSHSAFYSPLIQEKIDIDIQSSDTVPVNPNNIQITNQKQLNPVVIPEQEKNQEDVTSASVDDTINTEISSFETTPNTPSSEETQKTPDEIKINTPTISKSDANTPMDTAPINAPMPEQKQPNTQSMPDTTSHIDTYSIQQALTFRDHFLSEQSCADDLRELILSEQKSEPVQQVIQTTSYFCLTTQNVYSELNAVFSQAKKQALIHSFHQNNPSWRAYLLTALTYMIQVRHLHPTGDTLADKLDRAQNALLNHQVSRSAEIISTLPKETKQFFAIFLDKANNYTDAVTALDNLILSYAKGE